MAHGGAEAHCRPTWPDRNMTPFRKPLQASLVGRRIEVGRENGYIKVLRRH